MCQGGEEGLGKVLEQECGTPSLLGGGGKAAPGAAGLTILGHLACL